MATEIVSDLTGIDDLELTEAQADLLSTLGILVAFLGPMIGSSVTAAAIGTLMGAGALLSANDLRRQVERERFLRSTTTISTTTTTTTTTLDPSRPKLSIKRNDFLIVSL